MEKSENRFTVEKNEFLLKCTWMQILCIQKNVIFTYIRSSFIQFSFFSFKSFFFLRFHSLRFVSLPFRVWNSQSKYIRQSLKIYIINLNVCKQNVINRQPNAINIEFFVFFFEYKYRGNTECLGISRHNTVEANP